MELAQQLDNTLVSLSRFQSMRESPGRVWVADTDQGRTLKGVSRDLRNNLAEIGFVVHAGANEPIAKVSAPCIVVCGVDGVVFEGEQEQVFVVPTTMVDRLREVQAQIRSFDRQNTSYDNVKAFADLVRQGLFLSRRTVSETQRHIDRVMELGERFRKR